LNINNNKINAWLGCCVVVAVVAVVAIVAVVVIVAVYLKADVVIAI